MEEKTIKQQAFDLLMKVARYEKVKESECKRIISKGNKNHDFYTVGVGHLIMANLRFNEGKRTDVMSHVTKAAALLANTDDYKLQARALNLLGIAYGGIEEYQRGINAYRDAIDVIKDHNLNKSGILVILSNIASDYFYLGDYKTAIKMSESVYRKLLQKKKKNEELLFSVSLNLSEYCAAEGDMEKAVFYVNESEKWLLNDRNPIDVTLFNVRKSRIGYMLGNVEEGNKYAKLVLEDMAHSTDSYEVHEDVVFIVEDQLKYGEDELAYEFIKVMDAYAKESTLTLDSIETYKLFVLYYEKKGLYEEAARYTKKVAEAYDKREVERKELQREIVKANETLIHQIYEFKKGILAEKDTADRDALTGLYNRRALTRLMEDALNKYRETGKTVGCIFVDVDHFKEYNDTYGHVMGDDALRAIGSSCMKNNSNKVTFARYGGDEFFAVCVDCTREEICNVAKKLASDVKKLNIKHEKGGSTGRVTLSIGVAALEPSADIMMLDYINLSDKAVYCAKDNGKNCIYFAERTKRGIDVYEEYTKVE